jgi:coenzyme F420-0:L-glutamate ligase/coenzyme F420-1:gamma-L-glutamate ligase
MFKAGDDLAGIIAEAMARGGVVPQDGDVVVVAQKVVSKAEGRQVALSSVTPSSAALELAAKSGKPAEVCHLILSETAEVMRVRKDLVIVRHRLGQVMANAGIDASNVADPTAPAQVLLWPIDPDASARRLRDALAARFGVSLAVIVSDSLGRAWRMGTMGTAIGMAGISPLRDRRGETDLFGRVLEATLIGVADEIAAAASLIIGEAAEGTPVAIVRGATYPAAEGGVGEMLRPHGEDLFR